MVASAVNACERDSRIHGQTWVLGRERKSRELIYSSFEEAERGVQQLQLHL
jgi:hypothetical protein